MNRFLIIILLFVFLLFSPVLFQRLILTGDLYDEYVPVKYFIKNSIINGEFPFYSNAISLGYPIYRDPQAGLYFPLNILLLLPFHISIIVHIMLFFIIIVMTTGYYLLFRHLKFTLYKSAIITLIASFSVIIISRLGHFAIIASLMSVPYIILFIKKSEYKRKYEFLAALFIFFLFSGGHPHIVFIVLLLILILFINKNNYIRFLRIYSFGILFSAIIIVPLLYQISKTYHSYIVSFLNVDIKSFLYIIYPLLHFSGNMFDLTYMGKYNIYEITMYQSLFSVFLIFTFLIKSNIRQIINIRLIIIIMFLFVFLSPVSIKIGLRQPIRFIQALMYILSIYVFIRWDMNIRKKHIVLFNLFIIIISTILFFTGFNKQGVLYTLIVLVCFNITVLLYIENRIIGKYALFFFIALDLLFVNINLFKWEYIENIVNKEYTILENKRILTIIPEYYEIYIDYIRSHNKDFDTEQIKSHTSMGNRGVYYNAYSYNIYNSMTFDNYVDYFNDKMILRGGFSNFNFLLSDKQISLDYVFVPYIPAIFAIRDSLIIYFDNDSLKCWSILYTGNLKFENSYKTEHTKDKYLYNINGLKTVRLNIKNKFIVYGDGIIYGIKENNNYIYFTDIFKLAAYSIIDSNYFYLMKLPDKRISNDNLVLDFNSGTLINIKQRHLFPIDFFIGFIIMIIGFILAFFYYKKYK